MHPNDPTCPDVAPLYTQTIRLAQMCPDVTPLYTQTIRLVFCLNTWSQTRIRPGFEAESHEQEQSQEPDAHQARNRGPKPGATPRARRVSGQDPRPEARNNAKSQTRIRQGFEASGHEQRQADAEAEAEAAGGRSVGACVRARVRARACARAHAYKKQYLTHKGQEKNEKRFVKSIFEKFWILFSGQERRRNAILC